MIKWRGRAGGCSSGGSDVPGFSRVGSSRRTPGYLRSCGVYTSTMMRTIFACSLLAAACTVNNNSNPFGSGSPTSVGTTAVTTASNEEGSSSGSSDDGLAEGDEDTSGAGEESTTFTNETKSTADTGVDPADVGTTDGGAAPDNGQPADG